MQSDYLEINIIRTNKNKSTRQRVPQKKSWIMEWPCLKNELDITDPRVIIIKCTLADPSSVLWSGGGPRQGGRKGEQGPHCRFREGRRSEPTLSLLPLSPKWIYNVSATRNVQGHFPLLRSTLPLVLGLGMISFWEGFLCFPSSGWFIFSDMPTDHHN